MDQDSTTMMRAGEELCADLVSSMLLGPDNEVSPFLVFGWTSVDGDDEKAELSVMDAAFFHRDEEGVGKTLMMAFINGALNGHPAALAMIAGEGGRKHTQAPCLVFHVSEAWMVSRPVAPGETAVPTLPEGQSVSCQADRQEVVMIQAHRREGTCMGSWPLEVAPSGRKGMRFEPMNLDGEFFGRLAIRPATSD